MEKNISSTNNSQSAKESYKDGLFAGLTIMYHFATLFMDQKDLEGFNNIIDHMKMTLEAGEIA